MDNNDLLKPLNEILERAMELVRLAQAEDWDELKLQADKYQQHVTFLDDDHYIKALQDANLVDSAKLIIAQVQVLNDGLDLHASTQRDRIASELRHMMQSDKAIDAYSR